MSDVLYRASAASAEETAALAAALGALCRPGDCLTLRGALGAGKTTFARGLIQALAVEKEEIVSPTFTLVQCYEVRTRRKEPATLWHFDLYRLGHPDEMEELGWSEAGEQGICLIEWPEIIASLLPSHRLDIYLAGEGESRLIEFHGGEDWRARFAEISFLS